MYSKVLYHYQFNLQSLELAVFFNFLPHSKISNLLCDKKTIDIKYNYYILVPKLRKVFI